VVVTACVQAANVWSAGKGSPGQRWQRVAELHSGVALAHLVHSGRVLPLAEFADGLTGPLIKLLPDELSEGWDDIPLVDGDGLSGPAADVLGENLAPSVTAEQVAEWSWQSLSAEKVQGWLYSRLLETGTQAGYEAARLAVIRHPAGNWWRSTILSSRSVCRATACMSTSRRGRGSAAMANGTGLPARSAAGRCGHSLAGCRAAIRRTSRPLVRGRSGGHGPARHG